ncbi:hypothetical protein BBP40_011386 [Aspergillus hancockii]|nr:hypothetical protein BBP40_011386 [Aspergillus hancockii]
MPFGAARYIDVICGEAASGEGESVPRLGIVISWLEGAVSGEFVETFSKAFMAALNAFSSAGNLGASQASLLKDRVIGDFLKELRSVVNKLTFAPRLQQGQNLCNTIHRVCLDGLGHTLG